MESSCKMADDDDTEAHDEADLWFLPGPDEDAPDRMPGSARENVEGDTVAPWRAAQAELSGSLAHLCWHLGALDARLSAGPAGWRQRLALMEASELSWLGGERIAQDRILLWVALRLSTAQTDPQALSRAAWAARRLTDGPGPEADLAHFLARHAVDPGEQGEYLEDRVASWSELVGKAADLHPVTRAALSYWRWSLPGLDRGLGAQVEAAVTAARLGRPAPARALIFLPLAIGGAGQGLRTSGPPRERLRRWIAGAETATLAALRHIEDPVLIGH